MFQSLRDASPAVIDEQESPADDAAVVRPVFVDVRGHRRVWMRVSAAALAVLSIAFIAGAGLLLSERPLTAFPRLIGISEPENDEAVAGNGTASDAPDGADTTAVPGQPGRLPLPGGPGSNVAQPGALPGPSTPPGIFGQPVSPVGPASPGGVQGGVGTPGAGTPGAGTPAPGNPMTPRIDLPTEPAPPVTSNPPVEPPAPPVDPPPAPPVDPPPVVPPVDPPPVEPPVEPLPIELPPIELPLTSVSLPPLLAPILGP
jgi:hypothetical protein